MKSVVKRLVGAIAFLAVIAPFSAGPRADPPAALRPDSAALYREKREGLVRDHISGEGIRDQAVIESMRIVPREEFVPENLRRRAYNNEPLPIGYGQTISQPYVVALMTELLEPEEGDVVLEIGTGSGYQAAVLSRIVKKVYSVEIIEPLAARARETVKGLGYDNIEIRVGDGYFGWEQKGPFDSIVVTAASDHIPPPLVAQLKNGGKMCIPVGQPYFSQVLKLLEKDAEGRVRVKDILPVLFVPFVREWREGT
jgi:protein-L-isoaspartate(D-aspartate) O-methyltransferase